MCFSFMSSKTTYTFLLPLQKVTSAQTINSNSIKIKAARLIIRHQGNGVVAAGNPSGSSEDAARNAKSDQPI